MRITLTKYGFQCSRQKLKSNTMPINYIFCFNRVIPLKELFHQSILWLLTDDSPSQLEKMIGLRSNICTSLIRNFKKCWTIFFRFWPSMFGRLQCIVHMVSGVVWCWPGGRFQRKPNVKSVRDDADLDRFIFFFHV